MIETVIMTTGISVFGGGNIFKKVIESNGVIEFERTNPIKPENMNDDEAIKSVLAVLSEPFSKSSKSPDRISAEYSMMNAIKKSGTLVDKPDIYLFYSDSFGGKCSYEIVKKVLEKDFSAKVIGKMIDELDLNDRKKKNRAIGGFMTEVGRALDEKKYSNVCFAPIGGYKVMTSFGYIAGSFYGYPTYYLHEDSQFLHIIPPVPIKVNADDIKKHSSFIRMIKLNDIVELKTLNYEEKRFIDENAYFFENVDGLVSLNPFGSFIINNKEYGELFDTKVEYGSTADDILKKLDENQKNKINENINTMIKLLKEKPDDSSLHHVIKSLEMSKYSYKIFKPNQSGVVFRATYKYDKKNDSLFINHFWLDHNLYESEIVKAKGLIN